MMEKLQTASFGIEEERLAWEDLAAACSPPLRRLGAFSLVGFAFFVAVTTAVVLVYNLFGPRAIEGGGVAVPEEAFYAAMASGLLLALGGYAVWVYRSLRSYRSSSDVLVRGGLDPKRPTAAGLKAYSDEQLLALRSRFQKLPDGRFRYLMARTFGFHKGDSFSLGPLSVVPGTFEMGALRMEWETQLILKSDAPLPEIGWWTEGRRGLAPRRADEIRKLVFALRYTNDSVRELKRRYGYRTDRWHATVPEGKLFDAVRDLERSHRVQAALARKAR